MSMKKMFAILSFVFVQMNVAFSAQIKVSASAFEIFQAMRNPTVLECQKKFPRYVINPIVKKEVFRCPYCVDYIISGRAITGDIPSTETTTLKIEIRGVRNNFGLGFVPTYRCEVTKN